ncbi:cyclopropane fatty acyl phospholipid synthase [Citrobacter braakii]|nr:cyclopropane fatty acyl phospholipid synthase [Citrobacter braakii]
MSSSCIEDVSVPDDDWYRITNELLSRAGITINGPAPGRYSRNEPRFFQTRTAGRIVRVGRKLYGWLVGMRPAGHVFL